MDTPFKCLYIYVNNFAHFPLRKKKKLKFSKMFDTRTHTPTHTHSHTDLTSCGTPSPATTTIATPAEQHQQQQQPQHRWRSSHLDNSNNNHKQRRCRRRRCCRRRCRRCHGPSHTGSGQEAGGGHDRHVSTGIFLFFSFTMCFCVFELFHIWILAFMVFFIQFTTLVCYPHSFEILTEFAFFVACF